MLKPLSGTSAATLVFSAIKWYFYNVGYKLRFINVTTWLLAILLAINPLVYAQLPDARINLTGLTAPGNGPQLQGIRFDPQNPFSFNFIVDGLEGLDAAAQKQKTLALVRFFLAALTMPQDDLWVNLSPYEQNRIIPEKLSTTELGKEMLEQDYLLKQLAASLTYPETETGKKYWDEINNPASLRSDGIRSTTASSSADALIQPSFTKIWIMPGKAEVYEQGNTVVINEATLRVMAEEDYLAIQQNNVGTAPRGRPNNSGQAQGPAPTDPFKTHILPLIEQEVNTGKSFASVRQIYHSLILAIWFKQKLAQHIINQLYKDKNKIRGIDLADPQTKEKIYRQYVDAFTKGAYDYVKREYNPQRTKITRCRYFSGGENWTGLKPASGTKPKRNLVGARLVQVAFLAALTSGALVDSQKPSKAEVEPKVPTTASIRPVVEQTWAESAAQREVLRNRAVTSVIAVQKINIRGPDGQNYPLEIIFSSEPNNSASGYHTEYTEQIVINVGTVATTALYVMLHNQLYLLNSGHNIDEQALLSQILLQIITHEFNHYWYSAILRQLPVHLSQIQREMASFSFTAVRALGINDNDLNFAAHEVMREIPAHLSDIVTAPSLNLMRYNVQSLISKDPLSSDTDLVASGLLTVNVVADIIIKHLLPSLGFEGFYKDRLIAGGLSPVQATAKSKNACQNADWLTGPETFNLRTDFIRTLSNAQIREAAQTAYREFTDTARAASLLRSINQKLPKRQLEKLCKSQSSGTKETAAGVLRELGIKYFLENLYQASNDESPDRAAQSAIFAYDNSEFLTGETMKDVRREFLSGFTNRQIRAAAEKIAKRHNNDTGMPPRISITIPPEVFAFREQLRQEALGPITRKGNSFSPRRDKRDRRNRRERPQTQSPNETGGIDLRKTTNIKTSGQGLSGFASYQLNFDPSQLAGFIPTFVDSHKITANEDIFSTQRFNF